MFINFSFSINFPAQQTEISLEIQFYVISVHRFSSIIAHATYSYVYMDQDMGWSMNTLQQSYACMQLHYELDISL